MTSQLLYGRADVNDVLSRLRTKPPPVDSHEPVAGKDRVSRTPGDSHLSLERWKFKTRKKKKRKKLVSSIDLSSMNGHKSSDDDEKEEEENDMEVPVVHAAGWEENGRAAKVVVDRLLKRHSLDSAGSSEISSSEDGHKRQI
jgi:hypothetical protein